MKRGTPGHDSVTPASPGPDFTGVRQENAVERRPALVRPAGAVLAVVAGLVGVLVGVTFVLAPASRAVPSARPRAAESRPPRPPAPRQWRC